MKRSSGDRLFLAVAGALVVMLLAVLAGDSVAAEVRAVGFAVGLLVVFGVLMVEAVAGVASARAIRVWCVTGMALFGGIVLGVIVIDWGGEPGREMVLGMRPGTALLVFGVTLFPFWFHVVWIAGFSRGYLTAERAARLAALKAEGEGGKRGDDG